MVEKTTIQTSDMLTPPFSSRRPIPPPSIATNSVISAAREIAHQNGHTDSSQGNTTSNIQSREPVLDSVTTTPLTAEDSLPTISGKSNEDVFLANNEPRKFLLHDLDLRRLNRIHGYLWMAGRPLRARPLHRYKMLGMEVLGTQQMDLHLLKYSTKLLVKPLPEWMLSYEFWQKHICKPGDADPNDKREKGWLWKSAAGFLVSYVWLITTPLDLKIAHEYTLLPSFVTWHWWKDFVKDFMHHVDVNTLHEVNERYQFGDLRLGRINSIYRIRYAHTHFVRGYLYGYNRYVIFFQRNFSWILIVFVFFSLVLSAMQVGTSLKELENNYAFLRASYIFVVFSMVAVVAVLAFVTIIFIGTFFFNMVKAITHAASEQRRRRKKAQEGKEA